MPDWRKFRRRMPVVEARPAEPGGELVYGLGQTYQAGPGDMVVRGLQGDQYVMKREVFFATHDEVKDDRTADV